LRVDVDGDPRFVTVWPASAAPEASSAPRPEFVAVPVGAFADPELPSPTVSVWEERKHAWVTSPPGAERIP
jgi:hypothetical protein